MRNEILSYFGFLCASISTHTCDHIDLDTARRLMRAEGRDQNHRDAPLSDARHLGEEHPDFRGRMGK